MYTYLVYTDDDVYDIHFKNVKSKYNIVFKFVTPLNSGTKATLLQVPVYLLKTFLVIF